MVDGTLDDHIEIKSVLVQVKKMLSVVNFDQLDFGTLAERFQQQLFLFANNGM